MVPLTFILLHVVDDKDSSYYNDDNQSHSNEDSSNTATSDQSNVWSKSLINYRNSK